MGFAFSFTLFQILFTLMFLSFLGIFLAVAIRGIRRKNQNDHSPRLTVSAKVVGKRSNISHRRCSTGMDDVGHVSSFSSYLVTFQVASGDRMELEVPDHEFGLLIVGDQGMLTFQGTRYLGFVRT